MPTFGTASIPNPMPFGHAPNAVELPGGQILCLWYSGSYEGSEDAPDGSRMTALSCRSKLPPLVCHRLQPVGPVPGLASSPLQRGFSMRGFSRHA